MIEKINKSFEAAKVPLLAVEVEIAYKQALIIPLELKGKSLSEELRNAIRKLQTADYLSGKKSMITELKKLELWPL